MSGRHRAGGAGGPGNGRRRRQGAAALRPVGLQPAFHRHAAGGHRVHPAAFPAVPQPVLGGPGHREAAAGAPQQPHQLAATLPAARGPGPAGRGFRPHDPCADPPDPRAGSRHSNGSSGGYPAFAGQGPAAGAGGRAGAGPDLVASGLSRPDPCAGGASAGTPAAGGHLHSRGDRGRAGDSWQRDFRRSDHLRRPSRQRGDGVQTRAFRRGGRGAAGRRHGPG